LAAVVRYVGLRRRRPDHQNVFSQHLFAQLPVSDPPASVAQAQSIPRAWHRLADDRSGRVRNDFAGRKVCHALVYMDGVVLSVRVGGEFVFNAIRIFMSGASVRQRIRPIVRIPARSGRHPALSRRTNAPRCHSVSGVRPISEITWPADQRRRNPRRLRKDPDTTGAGVRQKRRRTVSAETRL